MAVEGHLDCFQVLAITSNAAMNMAEQLSLYECASFGYMPKSGIAGSCEASRFQEVQFINCPLQCLCYWCYLHEVVSYTNLF
ncbi:Protein of unknown function DUF3704 containing protein [Cricetulus griseus]|uniref:Uncharacterized protein n=1 Tax=Cricetulus griseus TaxID=10029 RepID=A0A061I1X3_CRIGR|nr:Protein of unknown function DUF3704 containing protein [Cricetulus griseus]